MRGLLNPKWLFLLNSLPLAVLLLLLGGEFSVIQSLLPAESRLMWRWLTGALLTLAALPAGYAAWCLWRRQPLHRLYGLLMLLLSVGFMFVYFSSMVGKLFPPAVPRWMVGSETSLYAFTFLMPTAVHALLVLVVYSVPPDRPARALPSFGLALAVPLVFFLGGQLLSLLPGGFWDLLESALPNRYHNWVAAAMAALAMVAGPLTFLFFLARGLFIVVSQRAGGWQQHELIWKILIAGVLPLLGLAVNSGLLFGKYSSDGQGIFGDFSSPWFYGLAALNCLLLCLPTPAGRWPRLGLLAARSALLAYTLYFFVVFLPWLPLSVLAIILIGTGFLMLAPTLLFVVHLHQLSEDLAGLRGLFARPVLTAAVVGGLLVLPLGLTATYLHYRGTLHEALAYVYAPDYARRYQLDAAALGSTLQMVQYHKTRNRDLLGSGQPYLSRYFTWLVLDNLTLAEDKLSRLQQIFADAPPPADYDRPASTDGLAAVMGARPLHPRLTRLDHRSRYDARQAAWVSWVDLEVMGTNGASQEYATEFSLPPGCWVQDYYLDIEGRREHGILAEKKAAAWVFAQIQNENRDPGILHYLAGRRLGLRVFPVAPGQVRRTGIRFVHQEPVQLSFDGRPVRLGDSLQHPAPAETATPNREVVYLSRAAKQALPRLQRRPYYHFLLDASAGQQTHRADMIRAVQTQLQQPLAAPPRFTLVNAYARTLPAGADWQQALRAAPAEGGCYAAGAIRQLLTQQQLRPADTYPVLVLVSTATGRPVLDTDFADLAAAYPESPAYYVLTPAGLEARSLAEKSEQAWVEASAPGAPAPVRAWPAAARPRAYLPDDAQPAVVLAQPHVTFPVDAPKTWASGLLLAGYDQELALHPAQAEATRLAAIQASFESGVMTPLTSYLSLENEAQKAALRRKQAEVLQANAALDAGEDTPPSAVPIDGGATLLLAAGGALALRQLRRRGPARKQGV
ncbi:MSEP-CTERM sorting domain-containing protein [Hymenobacter gummosus]|uniref:MSEP-CTERM sorting domain-containing protein n=1 Tax=Hymenobacter gummosus TaxID=1776032 RepID=A0A431TVF0_9BACT|nr:MSEP-CTERM sorting domain-containing protein [Hymenobacter gummosus]RTQ45383.1 MSEP-CTERM sorting domain-containing protein [Hymenobacter gummosus]